MQEKVKDRIYKTRNLNLYHKWIESGMKADFKHFIGKIADSIDATLPVMISKAGKAD